MSVEPESKESIAAAKVPQEEAEEPTASNDIPKDEGDKEEASEGASDDEDDDDAPADDSDFKIPLKLTKSGRRRATPFPLKVSDVMNHCCVFPVWYSFRHSHQTVFGLP